MATDNESKRPASRRRRPRPAPGKDWDPERYRLQVGQMISALESEDLNLQRGVKIRPYPDTGDLVDTRYLHRADTILTRDADAAEVRRLLGIPAPERTAAERERAIRSGTRARSVASGSAARSGLHIRWEDSTTTPTRTSTPGSTSSGR